MQKVSIIILHFGNKQNTIECIKSISRLKNKNLVIYVIDNGTGMLEQNELKTIIRKINLIKLSKNLGYAGGNNIGIKKSLEDKNIRQILLLNNDTIVEKKLINTFLSYTNKNKNIGICGCIITYNFDKKKIWFAGGYLNRIFVFTRHKFMDKKLPIKIKSSQADFISGAAIFIRREVFESAGLFDEDYFLYWEDVDFCLRAKKGGLKYMSLISLLFTTRFQHQQVQKEKTRCLQYDLTTTQEILFYL